MYERIKSMPLSSLISPQLLSKANIQIHIRKVAWKRQHNINKHLISHSRTSIYLLTPLMPMKCINFIFFSHFLMHICHFEDLHQYASLSSQSCATVNISNSYIFFCFLINEFNFYFYLASFKLFSKKMNRRNCRKFFF